MIEQDQPLWMSQPDTQILPLQVSFVVWFLDLVDCTLACWCYLLQDGRSCTGSGKLNNLVLVDNPTGLQGVAARG